MHIVTLPKSNVPYVGIPQPGETPFVVNADMFRAVLKGTHVTSWAIKRAPNGNRFLHITHASGRVHGTITICDAGTQHGFWYIRSQVFAWTEGKRRALTSTRPDKYLVQLRRLQKARAAVYVGKPPVCGLIPEASRRTEGTDHYLRRQEWDWHAQKQQRKQLARIAAGVMRNWRVSTAWSTKAYAAVRSAGFTLGFTFSERRQPYRDKWDVRDYWRNLPVVCGLASRPSHYERKPFVYNPEQQQGWRYQYLNRKRQAEELDAQITAVRELRAASVQAPAPAPELPSAAVYASTASLEAAAA